MKTKVETSEEFLAVLEAFREAEGISQLKISKGSGAGHSAYWNWRTGVVKPKLDTALNYAKALGFKVLLVR